MHVSIRRLAVLNLAMSLALVRPVTADPSNSIPELEDAVIKERWREVAQQCASAAQFRQSPILKVLKAHACLALNRNNDAVMLLASVTSTKDRQAWYQWAKSLAEQHPEARSAQYLLGDALLRLGRLDEAERRLTHALGDRADFALALNARGNVYVHKGLAEAAGHGGRRARRQWLKAQGDFDRAIQIAPAFAEAHASLGNLHILRRAAPGALTSYQRALELSPGYALALNGRGCAEYGLGKWEKANLSFSAAGSALPLPAFLANLRALAGACESRDLPGQDRSPLFRFTDFLDWDALRGKTAEEGDVFGVFWGGQLPATPTRDSIKRLNEALENPGFYDSVKTRLDLNGATKQLPALISKTVAARRAPRDALSDAQKAKVVELNRRLLEHVYPELIAQHDQRTPGHQLTLGRGLISGPQHRAGLSTDQILNGQARVDHLWRPMADFTGSIPLVGSLGKQWNRHLDNATRWNDHAINTRLGTSIRDVMPGGISAELRRGFVDRGNWPVVSSVALMPGGLLPPDTPEGEMSGGGS